MKNVIKTAFLLSGFVVLFSSCSKQLLVSTGANDHVPLIFNDEYKTENLKEVEVEGSAFWGIPSFKKNNQNNHSGGMLFTFNGVQVGKLSRILPLVTMVGYSFLTQRLVQEIGGTKKATNQNINDFYYGFDDLSTPDYRLKFVPSFLLGLPIAGFLNNITWNNAAFSGASATLNHRLISENPNVDVFFYPKYDIRKKNVFTKGGLVNLRYLWFQDATIKARVSGATLIRKK